MRLKNSKFQHVLQRMRLDEVKQSKTERIHQINFKEQYVTNGSNIGGKREM